MAELGADDGMAAGDASILLSPSAGIHLDPGSVSAGHASTMPRRDIIVIGGSAGAIPALTAIVKELPRSLNACVLVVLHTRPEGGRRVATSSDV